MIRCPKIVQASEGGGPCLARDGALHPGCRIKRVPLLLKVPSPGWPLLPGLVLSCSRGPSPPGRQAGIMSHSSVRAIPFHIELLERRQCCVSASQGLQLAATRRDVFRPFCTYEYASGCLPKMPKGPFAYVSRAVRQLQVQELHRTVAEDGERSILHRRLAVGRNDSSAFHVQQQPSTSLLCIQ